MSSSENAASSEACGASPPTSEAEPLRIVLLGRSGTGRSSSGNTILGEPAFRVGVSPCSVTTQCQRKTGTVEGRSLSVVDTPGFFHTQLSPEEMMAEVGRCVDLSSPGPQAFIVTLQIGRFTREERDALEWMEATFGAGVTRFTVVLFTWGDRLQGKRIEDFLKESDKLSQFVSSCHGGYHIFDNSGRAATAQRPQQVAQLLKKIDEMMEDNGGACYSDEMFKEAETRRRLQVKSPQKEAGEKEEQRPGETSREEEEARRRAERLFWCELGTALGRGAAEGAGIVGKGKEKGKAVTKAKVVERAAALAASPLSIRSAARAVEGAVREGGKVLYKHRKTFLH